MGRLGRCSAATDGRARRQHEQAGRTWLCHPHDLHEAHGKGPQSRGRWLQGVVAGATGLYWRDTGFTEISTAVHPISGLIQSETPVCLFPFKLQLVAP